MVGRAAVWLLPLALVSGGASDGRSVAGTLSVRVGDRWVTWWRAADAPARWTGPDAALAKAVHWRRASAGVEWAELQLSGAGEAWRTTVIVARVDPSRVRFGLQASIGDGGTTPRWTVDSAGADAVLALNAGQFAGARPWGWIVHRGREASAPAYGPLSSALVVDTSGGVGLLDFAELATARPAEDGGAVVEATQSYPALLTGDGEVPAAAERIDLTHRDGRLALGSLRDGRLLVVLTRFGALGDVASSAPLGLTVPELAALMGALGSRRAVALDGGLSSQLRIRDGDTTRAWRGWRRVPIGLVVVNGE